MKGKIAKDKGIEFDNSDDYVVFMKYKCDFLRD
jgi:hypothetical protein